jgi:hypothetical protein
MEEGSRREGAIDLTVRTKLELEGWRFHWLCLEHSLCTVLGISAELLLRLQAFHDVAHRMSSMRCTVQVVFRL